MQRATSKVPSPHRRKVTGDRIEFQHVVLNLLRNASDAMSGVDEPIPKSYRLSWNHGTSSVGELVPRQHGNARVGAPR